MSREEFFNRVAQEIEKQMRIKALLLKRAIIAEKKQKTFEILSNDRFEMKVCVN